MEKKAYSTWLVVLLALWITNSATGQTSPRVHLADDTIMLGDQTVLTEALDADNPTPTLLPPSGVEVLSQDYDAATHTLRTRITSFDPGEHWLHVGDDDSMRLVVLDIEVDTTTAEIRDIAPIENEPYTFQEITQTTWKIFRWVLLAGVVLLIYFLVRQRKKNALGALLTVPEDKRTPFERANDRLTQLRDAKLWQNGRVKEYYTELTDTVRTFIEECTPIHASEMTSDETIEALRSTADTRSLGALFSIADLVKFAKREPLPADHEQAMQAALLFVKTLWTAVQPATPQADKEAAKHDA